MNDSSNKTYIQYKQEIISCREIFLKKSLDYGASWKVSRLTSITDQMLIKINRIVTLEKVGEENSKVGDGIVTELRALVNYSFIALFKYFDVLGSNIKQKHQVEEYATAYDTYVEIALQLMMNKNHDYSEAWRDIRISSITDLMLTKIYRIKQIEDSKGKTVISENVDAGYLDILNYAVFSLIRYSELNENSETIGVSKSAHIENFKLYKKLVTHSENPKDSTLTINKSAVKNIDQYKSRNLKKSGLLSDNWNKTFILKKARATYGFNQEMKYVIELIPREKAHADETEKDNLEDLSFFQSTIPALLYKYFPYFMYERSEPISKIHMAVDYVYENKYETHPKEHYYFGIRCDTKTTEAYSFIGVRAYRKDDSNIFDIASKFFQKRDQYKEPVISTEKSKDNIPAGNKPVVKNLDQGINENLKKSGLLSDDWNKTFVLKEDPKTHDEDDALLYEIVLTHRQESDNSINKEDLTFFQNTIPRLIRQHIPSFLSKKEGDTPNIHIAFYNAPECKNRCYNFSILVYSDSEEENESELGYVTIYQKDDPDLFQMAKEFHQKQNLGIKKEKQKE